MLSTQIRGMLSTQIHVVRKGDEIWKVPKTYKRRVLEGESTWGHEPSLWVVSCVRREKAHIKCGNDKEVIDKNFYRNCTLETDSAIYYLSPRQWEDEWSLDLKQRLRSLDLHKLTIKDMEAIFRIIAKRKKAE